ncbi:glycine cleavage system protein GcvH [Paenibacillus sp. N4]|uniref:glycine cleavage system protein GcvH n=1 Tax=Paenibacillus vietnamensis TaxID=2590547 RepID=UPI001CD0CD56|nr:glycine cleavage system protein GcvH [Paenibacillus vietnamensis]MCA0757335.1 glycine cleavage system protein GcvH [Paenibacillus vietnamensis]
MSEVKAGYGYSQTHEWVRGSGKVVQIGITDFAQSQLGDIVFVEFPEIGASLEADVPMGTIESVKTVSDLVSPVTGKVIRVNEALLDSPEKVNEDPYGEGWLIEAEIAEDAADAVAALLGPEQYKDFTRVR